MPTFHIVQAVHLAQATLSGYGLVHSLIAIKNLRQWESTSEKAAKVSDVAATQLYRTRTTQGAGLMAILYSLIVSLALATRWASFSEFIQMLASPTVLIAVLLVRGHVHNFWTNKSKVPMAAGYNAAINSTEQLLNILQYLEWSWALTSLIAGVSKYA
ncbi:hypothetical protein K461DRAFT_296419 [Myriangium duriaei CBS 260.36]|uniref:Uncharacterized protein n=1 Tax=Myriangium duriaei CBS 260.36 TaxID=1168546 RepID=A0A9P4IYG7_9PEZI|nr:hypothetical protein K461DRAFT_296419 [Myriangium duriaei CBS 260.36]